MSLKGNDNYPLLLKTTNIDICLMTIPFPLRYGALKSIMNIAASSEHTWRKPNYSWVAEATNNQITSFQITNLEGINYFWRLLRRLQVVAISPLTRKPFLEIFILKLKSKQSIRSLSSAPSDAQGILLYTHMSDKADISGRYTHPTWHGVCEVVIICLHTLILLGRWPLLHQSGFSWWVCNINFQVFVKRAQSSANYLLNWLHANLKLRSVVTISRLLYCDHNLESSCFEQIFVK